ncbi:hypothetical protein [Paraburkholderia rhizosphaerae]
MINECEIYKHYLARAVTADGGETYLHAYDAPNFIADCETWNIAILGFDTFWIDETGILPFLDGIADFSPREKEPWAEYRSTCNRLSAEIVNQLIEEKGREKTYFSFVLLDETEYEKLP